MVPVVPWFRGSMVPWFRWFRGSGGFVVPVVPWFHGSMVPVVPVVPWFQWFHGSMVPWFHGSSGSSGSMVPVVPVVPWFRWFHGSGGSDGSMVFYSSCGSVVPVVPVVVVVSCGWCHCSEANVCRVAVLIPSDVQWYGQVWFRCCVASPPTCVRFWFMRSR